MIVHNRDYHFDIFGIKTLQRSYLLKKKTIGLSNDPSTCTCVSPLWSVKRFHASRDL